ncbi:MAG TPA: flagellar biosynthetic protein FliQ [Arenimonas sp.]|jgi:flagellar biosynthetic protein FliQ|uniref:flagellar biosynthetic protein FliQ n=1 Tax=Arenimonas sp. TaxID=1872635 RepID=UPI002D807194|nr:flagellar biosynthetic protein FliQ [Arenimonas sp.]HEU0153498.1 flagellar biosynthetic protein FliQ [Arenimonas sp.]
MDADTAMRLLSEMLLTSIKVAAPILIVTLVVGLVISVLQVVTQVQEMTLTFVPKVIAVVLVCVVAGGWMMAVTVDFATRLFEFAGTL